MKKFSSNLNLIKLFLFEIFFDAKPLFSLFDSKIWLFYFLEKLELDLLTKVTIFLSLKKN